MQAAARKRLLLFLVSAAMLLAAGYGLGYSKAHDEFYSPETLLANELVSLDFNNRLVHYANSNLPGESRRELLARLREQVAFVDSLLPQCTDAGSRREAEKSVENARHVINGQSLVAGTSVAPPKVQQ